jgi:hypothetical protein
MMQLTTTDYTGRWRDDLLSVSRAVCPGAGHVAAGPEASPASLATGPTHPEIAASAVHPG